MSNFTQFIWGGGVIICYLNTGYIPVPMYCSTGTRSFILRHIGTLARLLAIFSFLEKFSVYTDPFPEQVSIYWFWAQLKYFQTAEVWPGPAVALPASVGEGGAVLYAHHWTPVLGTCHCIITHSRESCLPIMQLPAGGGGGVYSWYLNIPTKQ